MRKRIVFRADGNAGIGFGHFYRLLAIAQMVNDDFSCLFAINRPDEKQRQEILAVCEDLIELDIPYDYVHPDTASAENGFPFDLQGILTEKDIVVIDGYHFLEQYQFALSQEKCSQVFVDDLLHEYPFAQAIINHAPGLSPACYQPTRARLCIGLDYAILRRAFFRVFPDEKSGADIYVSMGGSDTNGITRSVCRWLKASKRFSHIHVLGTSHFSNELLSELRSMEEEGGTTLYQNLSADSIVAVMDRCRFAFVSASTVLIEAYARGLYCFTVLTAQNQQRLYDGFVDNNLAVGLGNHEELTAQTVTDTVARVENPVSILENPLASESHFRQLFRELVR